MAEHTPKSLSLRANRDFLESFVSHRQLCGSERRQWTSPDTATISRLTSPEAIADAGSAVQ